MISHLKDVYNNFEYGGVRIIPDVIEGIERKSKCSFALIGSSPRRKWRAGIGALLLSLITFLRIL